MLLQVMVKLRFMNLEIDDYFEKIESGCLLYIMIGNDPLGLRAVKLDIDKWAYPTDVEGYPSVGDKVFCIYDYVDEKFYWFGYIHNGRYLF